MVFKIGCKRNCNTEACFLSLLSLFCLINKNLQQTVSMSYKVYILYITFNERIPCSAFGCLLSHRKFLHFFVLALLFCLWFISSTCFVPTKNPHQTVFQQFLPFQSTCDALLLLLVTAATHVSHVSEKCNHCLHYLYTSWKECTDKLPQRRGRDALFVVKYSAKLIARKCPHSVWVSPGHFTSFSCGFCLTEAQSMQISVLIKPSHCPPLLCLDW